MSTLYSLYIGTEQGKNGAIEPTVQSNGLTTIRCLIAEQFGGFSEFETRGSWIDEHKRLIQERSIRFDIVADSPIEVIENIARECGAALEQSSVLVTSQALISSAFCEVV
jgi:hypothetical protein